MDDELLWEVILSYVGNGSKAAPTAKILGAAARSRAARLRAAAPRILAVGAALLPLPTYERMTSQSNSSSILCCARVWAGCSLTQKASVSAPRPWRKARCSAEL